MDDTPDPVYKICVPRQQNVKFERHLMRNAVRGLTKRPAGGTLYQMFGRLNPKRNRIMEIQPVVTHHGESSFLGFSTIIRHDEGFIKCPEFWNEQYSQRFARLFQTMKPETPEEQAVIDNRIGQYAVCRCLKSEGQGDAFEYMICGEYQGGAVPDGMKLLTIPESDWAEFRCKGALQNSLQDLYDAAYGTWLKAHPEYQGLGIDIESYSPGNPADPDYEFALILPVKKAADLPQQGTSGKG